MYVKVEDGLAVKFPYTMREFRQDNPSTSFPKELSDELLADFGVFPVEEGLEPDVGPLKFVRRADLPVKNEDGVWETDWVVQDLPRVRALELVSEERDRRIDGGFTYNGIKYQSREGDRENISGAATSALAAIMNGATEGDYLWHGGQTDFEWIAEDNTTTKMDAQTMFNFGQAAMYHKQSHIFAARSLKDLDPIPSDFTDDKYWP
jgi:hypothetical protein